MPYWLDNFLYVVATSKRVQLSIILGPIFYIGISLLGEYMIENIMLQGTMASFQDVIVNKLLSRYDKVALFALISFWALAVKLYFKAKNRL